MHQANSGGWRRHLRYFVHPIRRGFALLGTAAALGCSSGDGGTEPGAIALVIFPTSASITQGGSFTVAAMLTRSGDFTGGVALIVTGPPAGVTTVVSDVHTTGLVTTAVVTINVGGTATPGSYNLEVHGTGTGVEAMAPFALTITVTGGMLEQWAATATASSQYTSTDWSANQATGQPNVAGCEDDPRAWASLEANGVDWLELVYQDGVRPTEIRIHEVFGVTSIVKVEVKDEAGTYHTVYTAVPGAQTCPRVLTIPVSGISETVKVVRLSFDQRSLNDWNEIDAVMLIGQLPGDWDYIYGPAIRGR